MSRRTHVGASCGRDLLNLRLYPALQLTFILKSTFLLCNKLSVSATIHISLVQSLVLGQKVLEISVEVQQVPSEL